jgi:hypothetical protein
VRLKRPLLLGLAPKNLVIAVRVERRIDVDQVDAAGGELAKLVQAVATVDDAGVDHRRRAPATGEFRVASGDCGGRPGYGTPVRRGRCDGPFRSYCARLTSAARAGFPRSVQLTRHAHNVRRAPSLVNVRGGAASPPRWRGPCAGAGFRAPSRSGIVVRQPTAAAQPGRHRQLAVGRLGRNSDPVSAAAGIPSRKPPSPRLPPTHYLPFVAHNSLIPPIQLPAPTSSLSQCILPTCEPPPYLVASLHCLPARRRCSPVASLPRCLVAFVLPLPPRVSIRSPIIMRFLRLFPPQPASAVVPGPPSRNMSLLATPRRTLCRSRQRGDRISCGGVSGDRLEAGRKANAAPGS